MCVYRNDSLLCCLYPSNTFTKLLQGFYVCGPNDIINISCMGLTDGCPCRWLRKTSYISIPVTQLLDLFVLQYIISIHFYPEQHGHLGYYYI